VDKRSETDWQDDALCSDKSLEGAGDWFFSSDPDERYAAKQVCYRCPVRRECAEWALSNKQIWGVWGGHDEVQNRRTLALGHDEEETRKRRPTGCPYCAAKPSKLSVGVIDLPGGGRWTTAKVVTCSECDFSWRSRTSANALEAYHSDRQERLSGSRKRLRTGCISRP
jgi:hypothetical protein